MDGAETREILTVDGGGPQEKKKRGKKEGVRRRQGGDGQNLPIRGGPLEKERSRGHRRQEPGSDD